jgi:hypothetical protein
MHSFRLLSSGAERTLVPSDAVLYNRAMHRSGVWLSLVVVVGVALPAPVQSQGRTPPGPVGASMALLATLQDAGVLPPEGSPEANRVIQIVIQFQGLFMKSTEPAVRHFVDETFATKFAGRAEEIGVEFRKSGWTSEIVEAVCDRYGEISTDERAQLDGSFARVNMRAEDFQRLRNLFGRARSVFTQQGRNIHRIFAEHRREMPGGKRFDRKERRDGDEGLYTDQGQDGSYQGRAAGVEKTHRGRTGAFVLRSAGHLPLHQHSGRTILVGRRDHQNPSD